LFSFHFRVVRSVFYRLTIPSSSSWYFFFLPPFSPRQVVNTSTNCSRFSSIGLVLTPTRIDVYVDSGPLLVMSAESLFLMFQYVGLLLRLAWRVSFLVWPPEILINDPPTSSSDRLPVFSRCSFPVSLCRPATGHLRSRLSPL